MQDEGKAKDMETPTITWVNNEGHLDFANATHEVKLSFRGRRIVTTKADGTPAEAESQTDASAHPLDRSDASSHSVHTHTQSPEGHQAE